MKKTKFSKLVALLSSFALAATSSGLTAFAVEEELSESTSVAATEGAVPKPDILSSKLEVLPDGSVVENFYHSDGSLFVPNYNTEETNRFSDTMARSLPASYDLRTYKLVTPVGYQGQSGMCWSFAALASCESNMAKRGLGIADFSEQHLDWFVKGKANPNKSDLTYGDGISTNFGLGYYGFNGAYYDTVCYSTSFDAPMKLASWSGPLKESYHKSLVHTEWYDSSSTAISESYRNLADIHVQDVNYLPETYSYGKPSSSTRNYMKTLIMENGAITANYFALTGKNEKLCLSSSSAYYTGGKYSSPNHAITIVGWNDNFDKTKFNSGCRPTTNGAWIVKNSWGTDWGNNGYFYMSYEEPLYCVSSYQVESKNNYKKVYQYDSEFGTMFGSNSYHSSAAHIFTATEDGTISAAAFGFYGDYNTPYTVRIYKGVTAGKPVSGTLAVTESGTASYPGYFTHELSKPVSIKKGELFSVVVSLQKNGSLFWADDYCYSSNESFFSFTSNISSSTYWYDTKSSECSFTKEVNAGHKYSINAAGEFNPEVDADGNLVPFTKKTTCNGDVCVKAFTSNTAAKPALPTGLTLTPGNGSITASWNAVSGASYYTVYTFLNGKYTKVGTPVSTKFNITGLKNGTKYGVLVLATNSAGSSEFTKYDVKFATPSAGSTVTKPALPTGLTLTPGNGSITASWNAVSGASYYTVYTFLNDKYTKVGTPVSTKFNITGLKNGTKYGVLVLATNSAGSSEFTKYDVKFATPSAGSTVTKPALPTGLILTPGNGYITATWNAVSGASYYTVYTYLNGKYTKVGTPVSTKFNITGLTNGTKYGVLVLATNSAGSSSFTSSDVKFATPIAASTSEPEPPSSVVLKTGDGYLNATWSAVSGATYYEVWYKNDSMSDYVLYGKFARTSVNIEKLVNDTLYSVRVYACNSYGKSWKGTFACEYPRHFATPAVNQNSAYASTDKNGTLHLKWDYISYTKGYQLKYYDPATGKNVTLTTDPGVTTYVLNNLAVGKTYTFYVRAYRDYSMSDWGQFTYKVV